MESNMFLPKSINVIRLTAEDAAGILSKLFNGDLSFDLPLPEDFTDVGINIPGLNQGYPISDNDFPYTGNSFPDIPYFNGRYPYFLKGRKFYIVSQGKNYHIESQRGHVWAPCENIYSTIKDICPGDIIFHYFRGKILAVSVALEYPQNTYGYEEISIDLADPKNRNSIRKPIDANRIDCLYYELDEPLDLTELKSVILKFGKGTFQLTGPSAGKIVMKGYIHPLHYMLAALFIIKIVKLGNRFHR